MECEILVAVGDKSRIWPGREGKTPCQQTIWRWKKQAKQQQGFEQLGSTGGRVEGAEVAGESEAGRVEDRENEMDEMLVGEVWEQEEEVLERAGGGEMQQRGQRQDMVEGVEGKKEQNGIEELERHEESEGPYGAGMLGALAEDEGQKWGEDQEMVEDDEEELAEAIRSWPVLLHYQTTKFKHRILTKGTFILDFLLY